MPDDAFYYLETASRFSESGKTTFDGLNVTNGFHPLYFLAATGLAKVFTKTALLSAVFALHVTVIFWGLWILMSQIEARPLWVRVLAAVVVLGMLSEPLWASVGMESAFALTAAVILCSTLLKSAQMDFDNPRHNLVVSIWLTILLLSRLDTILIVAPICTAIGIRALFFQPAPVRRILSLFAIPALGCLTYLSMNIILYGHPVPVSAIAKWDSGHTRLDSIYHLTKHFRPNWVLIVFLPFLISLTSIWLGFRRINDEHRPVRFVLFWTGVGGVLYGVYAFGWAVQVRLWYLAAMTGLALWQTSQFIKLSNKKPDGESQSRRPNFVTILAICAFMLSQFVTAQRLLDPQRLPHGTAKLRLVALELDKLAPPNSVIGIFDSGAIGYFSETKIVNLDGLANSRDYLENVLLTGEFVQYFQEIGLTHLALRTTQIANWDAFEAEQTNRAIFEFDRRIGLNRDDVIMQYSSSSDLTALVFRYAAN